ncbi:MAG: citrate synthase [Myxococcota bacterium]|nr:citrate synthase [Myxococcota bacterium]
MQRRRDVPGEGALLDAAAAMALLGVKRDTLYTYVSRGWLRRVDDGPRSLYLREDLERLAKRRDARAGHAATAAGALRFGEPVIDTAIVEVRDGALYYRGVDVRVLAEEARFEEVATLLWSGARDPSPWRVDARTLGPEAPLDTAARLLRARVRDTAPEPEWMRVVLGGTRGRLGFAEAVTRRLALETAATRAIERALIVIADHELNASTFAVRVAASTGASRAASLVAGLCAFSGPRHGTSSFELEALAGTIGGPRRARDYVRTTLAEGRTVPGFAHALYPRGDVRSAPLVDDVRRILRRRRERDASTLLALCDAMRDAGAEHPRIDLALVMLATALGAPRGTASWLFAIGRAAGWLAHAREQASTGEVLRPRARYVP